MTRALYRWLLWLHPPAFRQEFAGEMLWIFEEASAAEGVAPLFADGLISLLRQWLIRSGSWKIAAAVIGGLLQVTAGGLGALLFGNGRFHTLFPNPQSAMHPLSRTAAIAMNDFIHLAVAVLALVLLMVVVLTLWVKKLNARRV